MKQLLQAEVEQVAGGDMIIPIPFPFPFPIPGDPIYPYPVFHQEV